MLTHVSSQLCGEIAMRLTSLAHRGQRISGGGCRWFRCPLALVSRVIPGKGRLPQYGLHSRQLDDRRNDVGMLCSPMSRTSRRRDVGVRSSLTYGVCRTRMPSRCCCRSWYPGPAASLLLVSRPASKWHAEGHGGSLPATRDRRTTWFGTALIEHVSCPVCCQDLAGGLMASALQDANL